MYDKRTARFHGSKAPKQVFYEPSGNAAYWGAQRNTLPEMAFKQVDDLQANRIKDFLALPHEEVSENLHGYLSQHMMLQYLRVPKNKGKFEELYRNMPKWSAILPDRPPQSLTAPNDGTFKRTSRAFLSDMFLRALLEIDKGPWRSRIYEHGTDGILVLTDNPVVYLNDPITTLDFMGPCMMSVSQRRLYVRGDFPVPITPLETLVLYNVMAIEQAERLICASSQLFLRQAVEAWTIARKLVAERSS